MTNASNTDSALQRFHRSMARDFDSEHDGTGYDLDALAEAGPAERAAIESLLLEQAPLTWQDIEALAALDTPGARDGLLASLDDPDLMVRVAVANFAPTLIGDERRTAVLDSALRESVFYGGLTQALLVVEEYHPPLIMEALLQGVTEREGEVAMHFAAMLMYLHGLTDEPFDWSERPFFLEFHTEDPVERAAARASLGARLGLDGPGSPPLAES